MGRVKGRTISDDYPGLNEALVAHLEKLFPPKCLGDTENVALHHRYAGKVELVQALRLRLEDAEEAALQKLTNQEEDED